MPLEILSKDQSHPAAPQDAGARMWKSLGAGKGRGQGGGEQPRSPGLGPVFLSFACSKGVSSAIFKPMLSGETAYTMATVTECFCGETVSQDGTRQEGQGLHEPITVSSLHRPFKSFRDSMVPLYRQEY